MHALCVACNIRCVIIGLISHATRRRKMYSERGEVCNKYIAIICNSYTMGSRGLSE